MPTVQFTQRTRVGDVFDDDRTRTEHVGGRGVCAAPYGGTAHVHPATVANEHV